MLELLKSLTFTEEYERDGKRFCREYQLPFAELLCSQSESAGYLFAVGRLKDGRHACCWQNHARVFDSLDEMLLADPAALNSREKTLLEFGAHK